MQLAEGGKSGGDEARGEYRRRRNPDLPLYGWRSGFNLSEQGVDLFLHSLRMYDCLFALRGENEAASLPFEQASAKCLLKCGDPARNGSMFRLDLPCCAGKGAMPREGQKIAKVSPVDHCAILHRYSLAG